MGEGPGFILDCVRYGNTPMFDLMRDDTLERYYHVKCKECGNTLVTELTGREVSKGGKILYCERDGKPTYHEIEKPVLWHRNPYEGTIKVYRGSEMVEEFNNLKELLDWLGGIDEPIFVLNGLPEILGEGRREVLAFRNAEEYRRWHVANKERFLRKEEELEKRYGRWFILDDSV